MIEKRTKIKIGGVVVNTNLVERVVEVLCGYDRMPENPDLDFLKAAVSYQLAEEGLLRLIVFVCPKFDTASLFGSTPIEYMPTKATKGDLFEPRIPKIVEIREDLFKLGVVTTLEVVIGDNDFETYILPFMPSLTWDSGEMISRQIEYSKSFKQRVQEDFGSLATIWSLADIGVGLSEKTVEVSEQQYAGEIAFFEWLFSKEGPYKGKLRFSESQLRSMTKLKFRAYGAQGEFLEELGGILLQTEGPGVWLQRTMMLRCTGTKSVPAIYPWIRRDEVRELKLERR